jgi:transposase InsO family protein
MNQRIEFVLKAVKTDNFRALCKEYGISAKTGYKWRERFLTEGLNGMDEESRRPKGNPTALGDEVVCDIIRIKNKHLPWGPRKVRAIYGRTHAKTPSESSFKRVLERAGYTERRRLRKRQQEAGRLHSGKKAQAPNEVWTVDFKGWWYGAHGGRCEPLTVRDEFSRYLLDLRAMPNARTQTVRSCFERLFEKHGLPGAIRSDNGSPFANTSSVLGLTQLSAWWVALGIDLERGRPGCPQDNGGHERLHLDIQRELESQGLGEQQAVFEEWQQTFNEERPHEALEMKFPAEVYQPSANKFVGTPEDLSYPHMAARKVQHGGKISWGAQKIFISTALRGWSLGVEIRDPQRCNVWFGRLLLGQLEPATGSFVRTEATPADMEASKKVSPASNAGTEER